MIISRRGLLHAGLMAAGVWPASRPAAASQADAGSRRIALRNLHTAEQLEVEYYRDGGYLPEALARIDAVLRDFRTGDIHPMDRALIDQVRDVALSLGVEPVFSVISGYRSPKTNEQLREHSSGVALRSLHMDGRAMDVRLAGVDCVSLSEAALKLARGGVGYYRASDFVHLDTGAFRSWRG